MDKKKILNLRVETEIWRSEFRQENFKPSPGFVKKIETGYLNNRDSNKTKFKSSSGTEQKNSESNEETPQKVWLSYDG